MPELPEVEVVRRGLQRWVQGRRIVDVTVYHPRAIRRHQAGAQDFVAALTDSRVLDVRRRGKFLWFPLDSGAVLLGHLGMSGQLVIAGASRPINQSHLRVDIGLTDSVRLQFVDQRTFGGLWVQLPPVGALPGSISHIAPDLLDPSFDEAVFAASLRARRTEIKRALLDQTLISGVGNIYADEALWRARVHYRRATAQIGPEEIAAIVAALREVFAAALAAGGTSFDALYVNVNGDSGHFERSLSVYGRAGRACSRCGTPIVREPFANRSSYLCPQCQVPVPITNLYKSS
ncbi:MAG: bifunctional DNA-formamidopyrimidine glycosylase/DNA-(apurinic or apyrimidinic site) lyase [Mycobacteriales bacterium]